MGSPKFVHYTSLYGFYYDNKYPHQVVPSRGERCVVLKDAGYPLKVSDFDFNKSILSLTVVDQTSGKLLIRGRRSASKGTFLTYKKGKGKAVKLAVWVVPTKFRTLNVWFLKQGTNATSIRPPASTSTMVSDLNRIFWWQAAVWFRPGKLIDTSKKKVEKLDEIDFSTVQQSADKQKGIWQQLRSAAKSEGTGGNQNINLFFIKTWAARDHAAVCTAAGACSGGKNIVGTAGPKIGSNLCVIEEARKTKVPATLTAHELGHNLGAEHDKEKSNTLMDHFIADNNKTLSLRSIFEIHRAGK
ncbi:MAG: M12 family metallo-peptidase [Fuerstiella sp.]